MAKKLAHKYSFDASARQVRIEGNISHDRLLLITNVTDNVNIYNFADPTLAISNIEYDADTEETVVTLAYDTNQMSIRTLFRFSMKRTMLPLNHLKHMLTQFLSSAFQLQKT